MKNNKLKQKNRRYKNILIQQKDSFLSWLKNTGRHIGFFGLPYRAITPTDKDERYLIERMTNWQNHQWQKSFKGNPNRRNRLDNIEHYASMQKP